MLKKIVILKPCLLWVTIPHGKIGNRQIRPVSPRCNRCSHWLAGWDMRCVPLPDKWILRDNNQEIDRSLIRTGGSVLRHGLGEIIPRSSVSAVVNSDICNHVAHSRTLRYHSNQRVGFSNRTVVNRDIAIINWETLLRDRDLAHTGLNTHHLTPIPSTHIKSSLDSSSPDSSIISIHQQTNSCTEKGTLSADQDHMGTHEVSPLDITDGMTI